MVSVKIFSGCVLIYPTYPENLVRIKGSFRFGNGETLMITIQIITRAAETYVALQGISVL